MPQNQANIHEIRPICDCVIVNMYSAYLRDDIAEWGEIREDKTFSVRVLRDVYGVKMISKCFIVTT